MKAIKKISDAELVEGLRSGRSMDETVRTIYREYFENLSWLVMNNSGNRQDAEDIFQEVIVSFIELVRKDKFRGDSSIRTFLYSMTRHTWLNELKKRGRAEKRELNFERMQEKTEADVGAIIAEREAKNKVISLVEQLGETCKKILVMFYYENRPMKEILEGLEYENEQVVRNKKYKCLKQLEQMIMGNPSLKQTLKNLLHE